MENLRGSDTALFLVFGIVFGLFIGIGLAFYLAEQFKDIQYVKMRLRRSPSEAEYLHWRKELHTLYWCFIPGLTPGRVNKLRKLFKREESDKPKESDNAFRLLMPSILGICICAVCLAGSTFAWFTASQSTAAQTITAASYDVKVTIAPEIPLENGAYSLKAGTAYKVVLDAGSSTAATGYCVLELGGTKVVTQQFSQMSITIDLDIKEDVSLKVIPQWGTSASKEEKLQNGETYTYDPTEETTPDTDSTESTENTESTQTTEQEETTASTEENSDSSQVYTVVNGDTLTGIAAKYNTTVQALKDYNGLTDSTIQIDQELKIPPVQQDAEETTDPASN